MNITGGANLTLGFGWASVGYNPSATAGANGTLYMDSGSLTINGLFGRGALPTADS